jgi:sialate O-acetylesterase
MKLRRLTGVIVILFILTAKSALLHSQTQQIDVSEYHEKIRVACIGNSVTFGYGFTDRENDSYPARLQKMLGDKYDVRNFGYNGATLLKHGHKPYWVQTQFSDALAFKPHIVIIHLGLNDTDPRNWPGYNQEFIPDYQSLIKIFKETEVTPRTKVWICRMTPIFPWHPRFLTGTRDYFLAIQEAILKVSETENVSLIDLNTPLCHRTDLFKDAVHPSEEGALIIAETVKSEITGNFGGLSLPAIFTDHMVIQRRRAVKIWGIANAGQPVVVNFADNFQKTTAGQDGRWHVLLPPMEAGGPFSLTITGDKTISINDILIGEVWICSGQSNMAFKLKDSENQESEIAFMNNPLLRLFNFKPVIQTDTSAFSPDILQKINRGEYFTEGPWTTCDQTTAGDFSAVAYYFGKKLTAELGVPVGLINNAVGGSNTESWIYRRDLESDSTTAIMLTDWLHNDNVQKWCRERAATNLKNAVNPLQRHPYEPGYLYQSGIMPVLDFPVMGVIWYQGESNADKPCQHEKLFKMLVNGWRKGWNDPEMPFLFVQLSSLERESWPLFRDSQLKLLKETKHTGMVVTSDIGNPTDVHPRNKKDVGERLAKWALSKEYDKDIVPSGPLYKSFEIINNQILVSFCYSTDKLKTSDGKSLRGFEIAGSDGRFIGAEAKIKKNKVIVRNKEMRNPSDVRYGWKPYSDANLINSVGLPASTFTTKRD